MLPTGLFICLSGMQRNERCCAEGHMCCAAGCQHCSMLLTDLFICLFLMQLTACYFGAEVHRFVLQAVGTAACYPLTVHLSLCHATD